MNKIILSLFLVCGFYSATAQQGNQLIELDHFSTNVVDGSLDISFQIDMANKNMKRGNSVYLYPVLIGETDTLHLPLVIVHGKDAYHAYLRSGKDEQHYGAYLVKEYHKKEPKIAYEALVDKRSWSDKYQLALYALDCYCGDLQPKELVFSQDLMQQPTAAFSDGMEELLWYNPMSFTALLQQVALEKEVTSKDIYFEQGGSIIEKEFGNNLYQINQLMALLNGLTQDDSKQITQIVLTGYSSIEGAYLFNKQLALKRAKALEKWIKQLYPSIHQSLFSISAVGEDWEKLTSLLIGSDYAWKEDAVSIIQEYGIFDGRELKLMQLKQGTPYREMYKKLFSKLRRVHYRIEYRLSGGGEIKALEGVLNVDFAEQVYGEVSLTKLIDSKSYSEALLLLNAVPDSSDKFNNMGVMYALLGRWGEAITAYGRAIELGSENAKHNMQRALYLIQEELNLNNAQVEGMSVSLK